MPFCIRGIPGRRCQASRSDNPALRRLYHIRQAFATIRVKSRLATCRQSGSGLRRYPATVGSRKIRRIARISGLQRVKATQQRGTCDKPARHTADIPAAVRLYRRSIRKDNIDREPRLAEVFATGHDSGGLMVGRGQNQRPIPGKAKRVGRISTINDSESPPQRPGNRKRFSLSMRPAQRVR